MNFYKLRLYPFMDKDGAAGDDFTDEEKEILDVPQDTDIEDEKEKAEQRKKVELNDWRQELIALIKLQSQGAKEISEKTEQRIQELIGKLENIGVKVDNLITKDNQVHEQIQPPPTEPEKRSKYARHGL